MIKFIRKMFNRFFSNNLSLKLISIIVAIILWFYAVSELNPEITKSITDVPIEIINMEKLTQRNLTLTETPVSSVTIRVKGLANDIRKLNTSNLRAVLDLADIDWVGTHQVELNIEGLVPREVKLERIPEISLTINEITTKIIPVEIQVNGSGADGFYVHEATAEPRTVSIYGAKSLVDRVVKGLVNVNLDKDESTIAEAHTIKLVDAEGEVVESEYLHLRQDTVMVTIPIYPIKTLDVKANIIGQPAPGFYEENIVVDPTQVTVNGYTSIIDRLTTIQTQVVNIQDETKDVHATVELEQENGIYLGPGQPSKVNVVVYIKESIIEKEFTINEIALENIPEGFQAAMGSLDLPINIVLKGPYTIITPLTNQSLEPYVDLSKVNVDTSDFEPGIYELPIMFRIPDKVDIIRVSRDNVEINIWPDNDSDENPQMDIGEG